MVCMRGRWRGACCKARTSSFLAIDRIALRSTSERSSHTNMLNIERVLPGFGRRAGKRWPIAALSIGRRPSVQTAGSSGLGAEAMAR